jgi:epsilon-lactone hydrolase
MVCWLSVALICGASLLTLPVAQAQTDRTPAQIPTVDATATVDIPGFKLPYSSLASAQARQHFLDFVRGFESFHAAISSGDDINVVRHKLDERLMKPGVERLRRAFAVEITPQQIGGVQTDIITPAGGVTKHNLNRVLIDLHGGGFVLGAGLGGQMESIPIASLGKIEVITVNYREAPEHRFPAASEDVASVYRALLKKYRSQNIGLFGCSSGGLLAAEAVAWFQVHDLPQPGAIGIFGAGALVDRGDSTYVGRVLQGQPIPAPRASEDGPYFDVPGLDVRGPLVSPAYHPSTLAKFPPSLLISGTRDVGLSGAAYTHTQMIKQGVPSVFNVWEGAPHCSFAQPVVDPDEPESREAWDLIIKFFSTHLGERGR